MEAWGWSSDRQQTPASLHCMAALAHEKVAHRYLSDLRERALAVAENKSSLPEGAAAMYGIMGTLPDSGMIKEFVLNFMDNLMNVK